MSKVAMLNLLGKLRSAHLGAMMPSADLRQDRLARCIALLKENQTAFEDAMNADFGNRSRDATALTDIMTPIAALKHAHRHVGRWMKDESRKLEPRALGLFGARAHVQFQPKGVVGIIAPWNFSIGLVFSPLAGVLAAGNRVMIKPSEFTPRTTELLQQTIAERFDEDEIIVVSGGAETGAEFAALPFDHLVFTGAGSVARHVMRAAAENLVPVTLELGGKSPVVLGQSANFERSATRIMAGKILNAGQICLAPDHVFVPRDRVNDFVVSARAATSAMLPTVRDNPDYTAIISDRHFDRLNGYVEDARRKGATIVAIHPANEMFEQQAFRHIPPTLILDANADMDVMRDEIFGPVLPVIAYDRLDDVIGAINADDRPLALYYFGDDKAELKRLSQQTTSGGICINDVIMHCAQENLPFGGIGPSGMGVYHGRDGFLEFSHHKAVYRQIGPDLGPLKLLRPPYGAKNRRLIKREIG
jgi:coniferyl-aldehyde dehydrogenase